MKHRWPMHVLLAVLFAAIFVAVAALTAAREYRSTSQMLESSMADVLRFADQQARQQLAHAIEAATLATQVIATTNLGQGTQARQRQPQLPVLRASLEASSALTSLYLGYGDGDLFLLRRLRGAADEALFDAPPGTRYLLQATDRGSAGTRQGRFVYLDDKLVVLREVDRPDHARAYDPRERGWYREALRTGGTVTSEPYVFFSTRKVGLTVSTPVAGGGAVVGADIRLETLAELFQAAKPTPGAHLALVTPKGEVMVQEALQRLDPPSADPAQAPRMFTLAESGVPVLQALQGTVQGLAAQAGHTGALQAQGRAWRVAITPVQDKGGVPLHLVMAVPEDELLAQAHAVRTRSLWVSLVFVVLAVAAVVLVARRVSTSMRRLAGEAEGIRHFEFDQPVQVSSSIAEVEDLASTMGGMKATIRRFLRISDAMASVEDFDALLPLLLAETLKAADAQAGVLYLTTDERLEAAAARWAGQAQAAPALASTDAAGTLVGAAMAGAQGLNPPRLGRLTPEERQALGLSASAFDTLGHALAVPLFNRRREAVGCLLLAREQPFDEAQVSFIRALSGSAASSLETRTLIRQQKALFEALIRLIAGAIDAKSPYTGGHCARVPELTKMLARAACAQQTGPFADFDLDAGGWEAVHVAAWLHDCGKITTPEYVVDKATKLETIHDRIHEVRMRFEVLKREAENDCLKAILAGEDEAAARARLAAAWQALDDDYAFVAACNEGGEFMTQAQLERLREVGARTWLRTLDDRIGISQEERLRKAREPQAALPVREPLLADKPEHRIERDPGEAAVQARDAQRHGLSLAPPALLYDRGELHNLGVRRGTLTEEERYKINEHIVQTIAMLAELPFPRHLREVPALAGAHHEKLDGTGYPRGLHAREMSPVARMMAIADIFEALTAADRPYKPARTLSQSLAIMARMARERHIDADLFELFVREGVWRDYARRFLEPAQVDEVDVTACLAAAAPLPTGTEPSAPSGTASTPAASG